MDREASPMTSTQSFQRKTPRRSGSAHLQRAPRRRSKCWVTTPISSRNGLRSPSREWADDIHKSAQLTPRARGSPLLSSRNSQSPRNLMKVSGGSPFQQSPSKYHGDRFIPTRSRIDVDQSNFILLGGSPRRPITPVPNKQIPSIRVLTFGNESPEDVTRKETADTIGDFKVLRLKETKSPERILDAPGVLEDQGNHLLDWSVKNVLALALENTVYLWNSQTLKTEVLCRTIFPTWVTAVRWNSEGNVLAIAVSDGRIHCWNREVGISDLYLTTHCVTSLTWKDRTLVCGNTRGQIHFVDVPRKLLEEMVPTLSAHTTGITSLTWNRSGQLLASGCQDGTVKIFAGSKPTTALKILPVHLAAITVCQWSSFLNSILAVGTANGVIRVWRISELVTLVSEVKTSSKVTDIRWFPPTRGLFSSHSNGDLNFYTYPLMRNAHRFTGHEGGIICTSLSPDFRSLMSLGEDETLRIWNTPREEAAKQNSPSTINMHCLR